MAAKRVVHDEVLEKKDESALGRADREQEIDHPDDGPVPPKDKYPPAIWLLEDEAKALELFLFVRPEVLLFTKKLAEKIGQFVQILENRRLDDDFAHRAASLFHKQPGLAMRDVPPFLLLILIVLLIQ
jgi:hypothetical protein